MEGEKNHFFRVKVEAREDNPIAVETYKPETHKQFAEDLDDAGFDFEPEDYHTTLVALDNNKVVGFAHIKELPEDFQGLGNGPGIQQLDIISVAPSYQRKGIGKDLMESALNIFPGPVYGFAITGDSEKFVESVSDGRLILGLDQLKRYLDSH